MLKFAEFLLSGAMSRENAQAAAGDLAEMFPGPTFWASVARLAISASFRQLAAAPLRYLWTAFAMWMFFLGTWVVYAFLAWLGWLAIYVADNHTGLELLTTHWGPRVTVAVPGILSMWAGLVALPALAAWKVGAAVLRK